MILIAVVVMWINHKLIFNLKNDDNNNDIGTCQICFVAAVFAVGDLYLKTLIPIKAYIKPLVVYHNLICNNKKEKKSTKEI
jgi:hypothetical protein